MTASDLVGMSLVMLIIVLIAIFWDNRKNIRKWYERSKE